LKNKAFNQTAIVFEISPVRVHAFVIWLADLKAKPGAKRANTHPMQDW
jgi:hypothetical protein